MDLADPEWAGRVAYSPTGADFQAIVSAVVETQGEDAARAWLSGLADNGTELENNLVVLDQVNSGEVDAGVIYHYYWYRDQAESGEMSDSSALHFFGNQDPGAFLSVSGAGVLASSDKQDDAQEFVNFLASEEGQQAIADSYAMEYPLNPKVTLGPPVKPLRRARPAEDRRRQAQQRGRRLDDAGRGTPLSNAAVLEQDLEPTPGRTTGPARRTPPLLLLAGVAVALLALVPLGFVATYTVIIGPSEAWDLLVRPRIGELLLNTATLVVGCTDAVPGHRRRRGVGGRADRRAVAPALARAAGRAARRAGVREQLQLVVAVGVGARLPRRAAGGHAVLLPARLPAGRGHAARARPGAGGDGVLAGALALADLPPRRAAAAAPGAARRRAAGLAAPAGGVRRAADAAVPDLHDRDLRPVPLLLQRRRRQHDRRRAGAVLRAAADARAAAAGQAALRPRLPRRRPAGRAAAPRRVAVAGARGRRRAGRAGRRRPDVQPRALAAGGLVDRRSPSPTWCRRPAPRSASAPPARPRPC